MLIDHRCRLRAAVAIGDVEIEGADAMLAERAFERGAAVHRFGCVISHILIVVLRFVRDVGNGCTTFGQGNPLTIRLSFSTFPRVRLQWQAQSRLRSAPR
jgi:hypothetical protein